MDNYIILDVRGLLVRASSTADRTIDDGEQKIASWKDGLAKFLDREILPLLSQVAPRQVIAVWDGGNTYRTMLFSAYKARRVKRSKETSDISRAESHKLHEKCKELLSALGIKQVVVPGEEADDLIGLLAQKLPGQLQIWTVDEDLLQLMNERVSLRVGHETYTWETHANMQTGKGTSIRHMVLYKAIVGDTSDEYPGVKGLGKKAWDDLAQIGNEGLDWILQAVENNWREAFEQWAAQSDNKVLGKLAYEFNQLRLGWKMSRIAPEACFGMHNNKPKRPEWTARVPSREAAEKILRQINSEFHLPVFERFFPVETLIDATKTEELQALVPEILSSPVVSWDYESYDPNRFENYRRAAQKDFVDVLSQKIVSVSVNFGQNCEKTIYLPFNHARSNNLPVEWMTWLLSVLNQRPTVVQNANFEVTLSLTNLQTWCRAPYDTAIMAMYVDENEENHLKGMSKRVLDYQQLSYADTTQGRSMDQLTALEALSYGCDDSLVTSYLFDVYKLILQTEGMWDFYARYEVEPVLDDVFSFVAGTDLDLELLQEQKEKQKVLIEENTAKLHETLGAHVNHDKDAQTAAHTLFEEWRVIKELKHKGAEDEKEKLDELRRGLWKKAWEACWYTPYKETRETPEWKPTAAVFTKVARIIHPDAPKMSGLSIKAAQAYVHDLRQFMETRPDCDASLDLFISRLEQAADSIPPSKRGSLAFQKLRDFCLEYDAPKERILKEGDELNTGSPVQMQEMLYGKLRLPIRYRSKIQKGSTRDLMKLEGSPGTGLKAIASALVYDVPEGSWKADALHAYRNLNLSQQAMSLYYEKYPDWVSPIDGKLHPQIKNCGTATRRPSGTAPNVLQVSNKEGGAIRKLFPAGDYGDGDRVYVSIDWRSQEILILACESRDPVLMDAFLSTPRKDIHSQTGAAISGILMPRLGGPSQGLKYDEFVSVLHDKHHELHKAVKEIRGKYAKACIAAGSLVLTNEGLVPIEEVELKHWLWDGLEWIKHEGVVCRGIQSVETYSGLTATHDHMVYTADGRKISFGAALHLRMKLAETEKDGKACWAKQEFTEYAAVMRAGSKDVPVYDIVNAGPRHRFTVSGKLVANCNFLLAYLGGFHTLAENLLIDPEFSKKIYNQTLNLYAGLQPWQKRVAEFARKHGYTETAFGNRRHATRELYSSDEGAVKRMERQLTNAVIQSTAADILKVTRQEIRNRDMVNRYRMRAVKPIYDEFTASVPIDLAADYAVEMASIMRMTPPGYPVALEVDIEIGRTWGAQVEVEDQTHEGITKVLEAL